MWIDQNKKGMDRPRHQWQSTLYVDPLFIFSAENWENWYPTCHSSLGSSETLSGPLGGPRGVPGGPMGVPKFYQDPKTSQGTSRAGSGAFIWYKVNNFSLPITGTDQFSSAENCLTSRCCSRQEGRETCHDLRVITQHNPGEPKTILGCAGIVFLWMWGKINWPQPSVCERYYILWSA